MSSYEPLHHKYRPQTFADLVGQEAIATTLSNAIASQRIAPAYLFTGPRGTGKTSSARILAKSLNCLAVKVPTASPCGQCEVCRAIARGSALDVIEIDAASNTGVDNIREIIERSQFAPVQCRYKVYVIDECHMLSVAAFNALLKTLEEPPERVIFVLATTDPQRVLPTIISRCQRFDYRRIPLEAMVEHLTIIAQKENIEIEAEALTLVAQIANGGLRDAESLLDQLSLLSGGITPEKVWDLVGAVPERDLLSLLKAINSNNPELVIESCRKLMDRGREPLVVLQNLAAFYLNLLIAKTAPTRSDLVAVTSTTWDDLCTEAEQWQTETILRGQQKLKESEVQLKNTTQPRLWLEVTLLGLLPDACIAEVIVQSSNIPTQTKNNNNESKPKALPQQKTQSNIVEKSSQDKIQPLSKPNQSVTKTSETPINHDDIDLEGMWQLVLNKLPLLSSALIKQHGYLISYKQTVATVGIKSKQLLKAAQDKLPQIESAFQEVVGHKVKVNLQVGSSSPVTQKSHRSSIKPPSSYPQTNHSNLPKNEQTLNNNNHKNLNDEPAITSKTDNSNNNHEQSEESSSIPEISTTQDNIDNIEVSDDKIQKAAEQLAKFFKGEVINDYEDFIQKENNSSDLRDNIELSENSLNRFQADTDTIDSNEFNNQSQTSSVNSKKVKGRPKITENEEDLEF
ncbi:DNA polymerase III gamma and tau subunits [Crocosphaera subtropica ATCC 51142]|uniref:DNA polymerase III subunit gamma/tau n=1 Tax=Crocosphaera subtropica (strain ATCC 51142 / BH68) TaxID=43989 RepID=B1WS93_CROS5|nr:DNA polymerase III subunit gamma/tau [Crocosphaera subtropica]ACB51879.1 DNA polymerase III gamma and tau subunits [Crocosphaera subtropica ATCC 51142]